MSLFKSIGPLFLLLFLLLGMQLGCTKSEAKLEEMRASYLDMKEVSNQFVEVLATINDEASAKAALPQLKSVCEQMFLTGQQLDEVSKTTLRTAASLKKEVADFRIAQKAKVDEHFRRIKENPEAIKVLEPVLKEYGLF